MNMLGQTFTKPQELLSKTLSSVSTKNDSLLGTLLVLADKNGEQNVLVF